ncbi:MAG: hypothetical protein AB1611_08670 [bacterium]
MRRALRLSIMAAGFLVFILVHNCSAETWERVVSNGFGDPGNDYAWSMSIFKGKLYVGTLNITGGGEIWRSSNGEAGSWQKVYDHIPLSNLGIRHLYADKDQALYACTVSFTGAEILRTTDGQKWTRVEKGMGNRADIAFRCMTRFGNYLYAGAENSADKGAQLYRSTNGLRWSPVMTKPGFDSTKVQDPNTGKLVINNIMIGELAVFHDQLYAFTWTREGRHSDVIEYMLGLEADNPRVQSPPPGAFEVWRSKDGVNWEKVVGQDDPYGNGMGFCLHDPDGLSNDVVTSTTVFKGQLYLGTMNDNACSTVWRTADGTQWTKVLDFFDLGERANYYVWRMIQFKDKLFIGTNNVGPITAPGVTGAQIWASESGDRGTFYNLVHNGFDGETWSNGSGVEIPKNTGIRTFAVFNDTLFAGTATIPSVLIVNRNSLVDRLTIAGRDAGCEIWKMVP